MRGIAGLAGLVRGLCSSHSKVSIGLLAIVSGCTFARPRTWRLAHGRPESNCILAKILLTGLLIHLFLDLLRKVAAGSLRFRNPGRGYRLCGGSGLVKGNKSPPMQRLSPGTAGQVPNVSGSDSVLQSWQAISPKLVFWDCWSLCLMSRSG